MATAGKNTFLGKAKIASYLKNRSRFPVERLAEHAGRWVAWSPDGMRIVASSRNPGELHDLVRQAGEDPAECIIEGIPLAGAPIGGLTDR